MKNRKVRDFFSDLALIMAHEFLDECDIIIRKKARYDERRQRNAVKALRVHRRFQRVMAYDPWKATEAIPVDEFGDNPARLYAIKILSNRRSRIGWTLWCMYHYWMFDELAPGARNYGRYYSLHRKLWIKHFNAMQEKVKQDKWDKKREAVRVKRDKVKRLKNKRYTVEETLEILRDSLIQKGLRELNDDTGDLTW